MKVKLVFLFLFILPFTLQAQQTLITGEFSGAAGREIRLMMPEDYITYRPAEVASAVIDSQGRFSFPLTIDQPRMVELRIDHSITSFYVEPAVSYHVQYAPFDFNAPQRRDVNWLQEDFGYTLTITRGEDVLNPNMALLQELTNAFAESRQGLVRVNHQAALQAFEKEVRMRFSEVSHPFFQQFLEDHLAGLQFSMGSRRPAVIINEYLNQRPVAYDNPNYMYLLSRVFYSYIQSGRSPVNYYQWKEAVNTGGGYARLLELLAGDPVLEDPALRELVMILELSGMYNNPDFEPARVSGLLRELIAATPFEPHRVIARNLILDHTSLRKGFAAPSLELTDGLNHKTTLEDYRGKYVVLFFMTSWCQMCVSDLGPLAGMAETLQDEVAFVGVLADRDASAANRVIEAGPLSVDLYWFNHDYRLLESYRVTEVPRFVVIGPEGNLVQDHLPAPAAGAFDVLRKLLMAPRM